LRDKRIYAINIPELVERTVDGGKISYKDYAMKPDDYARLLKRYTTELIINVIAPRLRKEDFLERISIANKNGIKKYMIFIC
jgi:hypothetical protein